FGAASAVILVCGVPGDREWCSAKQHAAAVSIHSLKNGRSGRGLQTHDPGRAPGGVTWFGYTPPWRIDGIWLHEMADRPGDRDREIIGAEFASYPVPGVTATTRPAILTWVKALTR